MNKTTTPTLINNDLDYINREKTRRFALELIYGKNDVFDTEELRNNFNVIGFMAPFVVVIRKSDNVKGSLQFDHLPRFYYGWMGND